MRDSYLPSGRPRQFVEDFDLIQESRLVDNFDPAGFGELFSKSLRSVRDRDGGIQVNDYETILCQR